MNTENTVKEFLNLVHNLRIASERKRYMNDNSHKFTDNEIKEQMAEVYNQSYFIAGFKFAISQLLDINPDIANQVLSDEESLKELIESFI